MTIVLAAANSTGKRRWRALIESAKLGVFECARIDGARFHSGPALLLAEAKLLTASKKALGKLRARRPDLIVVAYGDENSMYGDLGGALACGAVDFLSESLPDQELRERLLAHLPEEKHPRGPLYSPDKTLRLDRAHREAAALVRGKWKPLPVLTPKEYDLLCLFLRFPGAEFSRQHLLEEIWGASFRAHPEAVDKQVGALRKKLGARGKSIATVRGVGYKFY